MHLTEYRRQQIWQSVSCSGPLPWNVLLSLIHRTARCEVAGFFRKMPAQVVDLRCVCLDLAAVSKTRFFVGCLSPSPIFGVVPAAWGNSRGRGTPLASPVWTPPLGLAAIRALSPAQESFHDAGKSLAFENTQPWSRVREN